MRKWVWIGIAIVAIIALGVGGSTVLARQNTTAALSPETGGQWGLYLDSATLVRVATALGLTPQELTTQLQGGKTLAQVAQDKGVETGKVVEAVIAPYKDQLQLQLKYGVVTQAQADFLLTTAKQRAEFLLSQTIAAPGTPGGPNLPAGTTDMTAACNSMMADHGGGMMGGQSSGMMDSYSGGMMEGWGGTPRFGSGFWGRGMMGGW